MAGVSAPSLSIAIANAGGLGSCGVVLMQPDEITRWANEVRSKSNGAFQLNTILIESPPGTVMPAAATVAAGLPVTRLHLEQVRLVMVRL
jgi:NAD(P)H-dependent flavin oxidoreductase YrpB (nitropropane dioxygenase family)